MSASDHLGPQFQQLPLLMTPHEVGQLRSGDYGLTPMSQAADEVREGYKASAEKATARGFLGMNNLGRVRRSVGEKGFLNPVDVTFPKNSGDQPVLENGHHRATVSLENNLLLPVKFHEAHRRGEIDFGYRD